MRELIKPTTDMYEAFRDCYREWGPGLHEDGFGIDERDNLESREGFETWIHRMLAQVHHVDVPSPDRPHWEPRWIVEDGQILGGIALRHKHDEWMGRVGYGVRASARRRGAASWALSKMLERCHDVLGLDRALLVCLEDNIASARTIERCGGVLEGIVDDEARGVRIRRYWATLT